MKLTNSPTLKWIQVYIVFILLHLVTANRVRFNSNNNQICSGIYSKQDWGGKIKPKVDITLTEYDGSKYQPKKEDKQEIGDPVSFVIFEYRDMSKIGAVADGTKYFLCDDEAIDLKLCDRNDYDRFIVDTKEDSERILSSEFKELGKANVNYTVEDSGYYCVVLYSLDAKEYSGYADFQNAFGYLSASEIPKLPAYGALTICYAVVLALFAFQFFKKRNESQILPLQRYLLAMWGFLTFDSFTVWSYYDLLNRTRNPASAFVTCYMILITVLNSAKVTFSLFILLCIALGYGVVLAKLPKKIMFRCKLLAGYHFVASTVFLLAAYYAEYSNSTTATSAGDPSKAGPNIWLTFTAIPLLVSLVAYYLVILLSIRSTTLKLQQQRQVVKLKLYRNLFRIIFASVVLIIIGIAMSSFIFINMSATEVIEKEWKGAFFVYEFWPSVVYFAVFAGVSWLWRPTETSYMLAVSQQLSTEETNDPEVGQNPDSGYHQGREFELDDLSLISHSDHENEGTGDRDSLDLRQTNPPDYNQINQDDSALNQAEKKNYRSSGTDNPHESTLFELGEGSDDENRNTDDRLKDK